MKQIRLGHSSTKQQLIHAFKFALVGMVGLLIDFSVTWIVKEILYINVYVANGSGFILAASGNFYLNKNWTFNDPRTQVFKQYLCFFIVSLFGLLLNTILLYLFFGQWGWPFYPAKFMAVIVVFLWNFLANSFFTFKRISKL